MFKDYTLQTTWGRALVALIVGTVLGALIVAGFIAYEVGPHMFLRNAIRFVMAKFASAFMVWGSGILLVGAPIWLVLHKAGFRTWLVALFTGFLLPFALFFPIFTGQLTGIKALQGCYDELAFLTRPVFASGTLPILGAGRAAAISAVFGAVGALIALTIWFVAYKRPDRHA